LNLSSRTWDIASVVYRVRLLAILRVLAICGVHSTR
jgi:hypothetical protein